MSLVSDEELPSPVGDLNLIICQDQLRPLEILYQLSLKTIGLAERIAEAVEIAVAVVVRQEGLSQSVASLRVMAMVGIKGRGATERGNGRLPAAQCVAKQPQLYPIPARVTGMVLHTGFVEVLDQQSVPNERLGYGIAQALDPSESLEACGEDLMYPVVCLREGSYVGRVQNQMRGGTAGHQKEDAECAQQ